MRHRRDTMGMTDEEIAQIVRDEWVHPMDMASKSDTDAFDYFASQEQSAISSQLITHLTGALICSAMVSFVAALVILGALGDTGWSLAFCAAACVMLFIATIFGFARK